MDLTPKVKSETQLNGIEKFDIKKWSIPYATNVNIEFENRYEKLIETYKELKEEVEWNNIIYSIDIKFKPIINKLYYLYFDSKYSLSMISPTEWNKESLGTFKIDHNGKWNKIII